MRKYQLIWERVRLHSTASLTADPSVHGRIIQAVRKEKSRDAGWRLLNSEKGVRYEMQDKVEGDMVTFTLVDVSPLIYRL